MIKFNKEKLRDKIYACWVGKNIGGTMGGPYECSKEILDVKGFVTAPGEPLPNDDLDLQLVWMRAVDEMGIENINARTLGEYWMSTVSPFWNEYGICKMNMQSGLMAPLCGEVHNEEWKHSNGAWIRTEIWATLFPGDPENACRFAYEDACVDHGFGEGTFAAIFIAAIQSAAFIINDAAELIKIGLSKIPADCRVAKAVNTVLEGYKAGKDWKQVRNELVEQSIHDIGWFQAPANVGFAVLGLTYGKCDFKKSMLYAINCGDDTDCTAATVGATLGLMYGMEGIPADWHQYIGDGIRTCSVVIPDAKGKCYFPASCTQLTDCVMNLIPAVNRTPNRLLLKGLGKTELTDGADDFSQVNIEDFCGREFVEKIFSRSPYNFVVDTCYGEAVIEYEKEPILKAGESLKGKITVTPNYRMEDQKYFNIRWILPEGWQAISRATLFTPAPAALDFRHASIEFEIIAGERVEGRNRILCDMDCQAHPTPIIIPMIILG